MTPNETSRLGSDTETAQQASASKLTRKNTRIKAPAPGRADTINDVEHRLLTLMTTPEGMATVIEESLNANVFEDPITRIMFEFMTEHHRNTGKPPTVFTMDIEYPSERLPMLPDVGETAEWCCENLKRRYQVNQGQDIIRRGAFALAEEQSKVGGDPGKALRMLVEECTTALANTGEAGAAALYTDVAAMLDDTLPESPRPEILARADGVRLFYRGEVNLLFGDPEHGKTWVGLAACAEVLAAGGRVMVADIDHNGAAAIVSRLLLLGAPKEALRDQDRFRHCEPGEVSEMKQLVTDSAGWKPDVVMVDSTGELLPMFWANSDNGDDFTRVHARVLQPLADTGASVLLVDHLAKGRDSRALGPGGTMAKRRTVGGLSLRVVREQAFTRSGGGSARLLINKDRHGGVRDHCPPSRTGRDSDEQLAGTFVLDVSHDGLTVWSVTTPQADSATSSAEFRPTVLMERASRVIEAHPGEFTRNKVATKTGGKKETTLLAIDVSEREEFVTRSEDTYPRYSSTRSYRQTEDPHSEHHMPLGDVLRRHRDHSQDDLKGGQRG